MKECKESKKLGHDLSYKGSFKRSLYKKMHGKDFRKGRKNFKRKKVGTFPKKGRNITIGFGLVLFTSVKFANTSSLGISAFTITTSA
jgi:hypothetical protein